MLSKRQIQSDYRLGYNLASSRVGQRLHTVRKRVTDSGVLSGFRLIVQVAACYGLYAATHRNRFFNCFGETYEYLDRPLHTERVIEIPIGKRLIQSANRTKARVLEVGNVLGSYIDIPHDVVDKYEVGTRIQNVDVVDFRPIERYDLVISISTLEHVGFDEVVRDPAKFEKAVHHLLEDCLNPGGRLFITLPIGYNPAVDDWVAHRARLIGKFTLLERISVLNLWLEKDLLNVDLSHARLTFDREFPGASAIVVWEGTRPPPQS